MIFTKLKELKKFTFINFLNKKFLASQKLQPKPCTPRNSVMGNCHNKILDNKL